MKQSLIMELVDKLNGILKMLETQGCRIYDSENPDFYITNIEYHKADSIGPDGKIIPGIGNRSDNFYCKFKGES